MYIGKHILTPKLKVIKGTDYCCLSYYSNQGKLADL